MLQLPESKIETSLKQAIDSRASQFASIRDAERAALSGTLIDGLRRHHGWPALCDSVNATVRQHGYVVIRGVEADEGRSLLIISRALGTEFDTYGPRHVVKRFRMSPWTTELSHTTRAGEFHTDGNVSEVTPVATVMQCEQEDPGAPEFAEQRVAHLPDLLVRLRSGDREDSDAAALLTDVDSGMAHERSSQVWRGRLVQHGTIRYHPQSLRVAARRLNESSSTLDSAIAAIARAARDVSLPFHTGVGDTVLISNRTALHYRGECSVRFTEFPTEFESRSVLVLHLREPTP